MICIHSITDLNVGILYTSYLNTGILPNDLNIIPNDPSNIIPNGLNDIIPTNLNNIIPNDLHNIIPNDLE